MDRLWIKINDDFFFLKKLDFQLSMWSHGNLDLSLDLKTHPHYLDFFFDLYEKRCTFTLISKSWETKGSIIKSVNYDVNSFSANVSIRYEVMSNLELSDRRDQIIEDLLNIEDKNNII